MNFIVSFFGKRKVDDDFWEDVEELRQMTERSIIGPTNWASGPPKPGEATENPNAIVMGRARPKPGPSKETEPEPVKETLREKRLRLRAEVKELEREKKESSKID